MVTLRRLAFDRTPDVLQQYLHVKYQVFVNEQGWELPANGEKREALPDRFDPHSEFVLAFDDAACCIGIVRTTTYRINFPHRELFAHHLEVEPLRSRLSTLATINGLAVVPQYRHEHVEVAGHGRRTVAQALMIEAVQLLRDRETLHALVTTDIGPSTTLCHHLGFYLIDPPRWHEPSGRRLINMGLVFDDRRRLVELDSPLLETCGGDGALAGGLPLVDYFARREHEILGCDDFATFVREAPRN